MFWNRKCKHPWNRIAVMRKEEMTGQDDLFDYRTSHMVCMECGEELERKFVTLIDGIDGFLAKERALNAK